VKLVPQRYNRLGGLLPSKEDVQDDNRDLRAYRLARRRALIGQLNVATTVNGTENTIEGMAAVEELCDQPDPRTRTGQRASRMMDSVQDHLEQSNAALNKQLLRASLELLED
jgi:hypothetical protein